MLDSGAFTEIMSHGHYRDGPETYAAEIQHWGQFGNLKIAVTQDYMCEAGALESTGLTITDHQRLTIERYDALQHLLRNSQTPLMPVIQGQSPVDYRRHIQAYGNRIDPGAWIGVGSICKRNGKPEEVAAILRAIKEVRPDVRLHGFGLKLTSLRTDEVRGLLHSADSMAWSFAARWEGKGKHDWREAAGFVCRVEAGLVKYPKYCKHCGSLFESVSRIAKACSKSCRQKAYRRRK